MSESRVIVNPETQVATLYIKEDYSNWNLHKNYLVSTGKKYDELGNRGQGVSPVGKHEICQKIGEGEKEGTIFIGRVTTAYLGKNKFIRKIMQNKFLKRLFKKRIIDANKNNPLNKGKLKEQGFVLTRILRLKGLEEQNSRTYERYIYLHGTRFENKLGRPNTNGCIVFSSKDIIDMFNNVAVGTKVNILNKIYNPEKAESVQKKLGLK